MADNKYYLGIDNGGTTAKASLFDIGGNEIATCSISSEISIPHPGYAERDMNEMWKNNCQVIRDVLEKSGIAPERIKGIACCGHGKGLYLWGEDGPVRKGILSADGRASAYPAKWENDGTADKVYAKTFQKILACQPVSLLAWIKDNEPEAYGKIRWVFECKDYIRFMLTGKPCAEITDYSGANLVNLGTGKYDTELLGLFGLEDIADKLPPLVLSTDTAGYVTEAAAAATGLKAGTPVAGGMFDIDACAVGTGALDNDTLCMIAGTWSINEYVSTCPVTDGTVMMNSLFCIPGYYLIEECSPTSAGNNEWFINTLMKEVRKECKEKGESVYEYMNRLAGSVDINDDIPIFLPYVTGCGPLNADTGGLLGLKSYHTRAHIARSVYEGIVFGHRLHLERLLKTRDSGMKRIRLAGGAANSVIWSQMFADITGIPTETVSVSETGNLGCAIAAATASGDFRDVTEAAKRMVKVSETYEPIPANSAGYETRYRKFRKLIDLLYN